MKVLVSFLAIFAGLMLIGMGYTLIAPTQIGVSDYDGLLDLEFTDAVSGEAMRLSSLVGTPIVVNLWVSWNSYCKDELIDFAKFQVEYGENVKVVAINSAERDLVVSAFLRSHPEILGLEVWLDPDDLFFKKIDAIEVPETIFIDRAGRVTNHHRGHITYDQIQHSIETLIYTEY